MSRDIQLLEHYFRQWYLKMNTSKSISAYFHLNNREANETLKIQTANGTLPADKNRKYMGLTLDRSLTYRKHIYSVVQKLKERNNLLRKISGTTWRASQGDDVRTSALALCYSVAEYACPVWNRSSHAGKVDTCLNDSMRTISGVLKSTPRAWLPVMSGIAPRHIRRAAAEQKKYRTNFGTDFTKLHQEDSWICSAHFSSKFKKPIL